MAGDKDYTLDAIYTQEPLRKLIYRGRIFSLGFIVDSVANGGRIGAIFSARSADLHLSIGYATTGTAHMHFYNVTSWTGGTPCQCANLYTKYQGVNSLTSEIVANPTSINVQVSSNAIWSQLIPGGLKSAAQGGTGGPGQSVIIGQGHIIFAELVNLAGTGASMSMEATYHEAPIAQLDDPD